MILSSAGLVCVSTSPILALKAMVEVWDEVKLVVVVVVMVIQASTRKRTRIAISLE